MLNPLFAVYSHDVRWSEEYAVCGLVEQSIAVKVYTKEQLFCHMLDVRHNNYFSFFIHSRVHEIYPIYGYLTG